MTWFKVDDGLPDHPKVIALGKDQLPAMGLWTLVGAWAARYSTGGHVPEAIVRRHDPRLRLARKLVEVGLWERDYSSVTHELLDGNPHFKYHDWFDIQPSQVEVERKKEQNRERQRRFRLRRAGVNPDDPGPGETSQPEDGGLTNDDLPGPDEHPSRNGARNALPEALVTSPCPDLTRPKEQGKNLSSAKPPREDVDRLCAHLADRVEANTSRRPTITKRWRDSARLLLDKDLANEPDPLALALRLADWATNDEFWRTNVLSMPTFRDKFDQLRLKARRQWEQNHAPAGRRTTDDKRAAVPALVAQVLGTDGTAALRPDLRAITGGAQP